MWITLKYSDHRCHLQSQKVLRWDRIDARHRLKIPGVKQALVHLQPPGWLDYDCSVKGNTDILLQLVHKICSREVESWQSAGLSIICVSHGTNFLWYLQFNLYFNNELRFIQIKAHVSGCMDRVNYFMALRRLSNNNINTSILCRSTWNI